MRLPHRSLGRDRRRWPCDESLEDSENLPAPEVIAAEIVEDLQAALDQFAQIAADLGNGRAAPR